MNPFRPGMDFQLLVLLALLANPAMLFGADEDADPNTEPPLGDTDTFEETSDDFADTVSGDEKSSQALIEYTYKVGYSTKPVFGGPNSPEGQLEEADRITDPAIRLPAVYGAFEPWRDWKRGMNEKHGFQFSGHYTTLAQKASDTLPGNTDKASSGVLRGTAKWTLLNRGKANPGALAVMVDHRHAYRDVAPAGLANQIGYAGVTGVIYSDIDLRVVNLNWQQSLNDGNAGLLIGRYDPNDYHNILGTVNPWTMFSNVATLLDASIVFGDSSWGIAGGSWFDNQWYFTAGLNDANGTVGDSMEFFDGGAEFYKWVEFGWSPGKENRYFRNIHVMTWHVDERDDIGYTSGKGVVFAANWLYGETFMPYVRAGWSEGAEENKIYDRSATIGLIYKYRARSDLGGIAINWGRVPKKYFPGAPTQTTIEAFWRFQLAQNFEITPSLQFLIDPASNPAADDITVFGLRTRLTF